MHKASAMQIGPLPPGNEEAIRPLFQEVFGHDITPALLRWKYGEGRGLSWVARGNDDQVLLHCGVAFRKALVGGKLQSVAQLVDLMASPRAHGGISRRQAPFYQLISMLLESIVATSNPGAWAFGFPSDRAMRLGEHLGVFRTIDQMYELTFTALPPGGRRYHLVRVSTFSGAAGRELLRLWELMAADLGDWIIGVRDSEYLQHRYLQHPDKQYEIYLVQSPWLRRGIGCFVIRREGEEVELMEMVAPLRQMSDTVQAARRWLHGTNAQQLKLWLTSGHISLFTEQAASVNPLEFRIMANPSTPPEELLRFHQRWWLTSGDTDYR